MPLDDHPITLRIRITLLPLDLSRFRSHIPFYHITCIRTHRRVIQLQQVALYDAYLLLFLIDTLFKMASVHRNTP